MNNRFFKINHFLPEKLSHIVWKDEINGLFILTKFGEIFRYDRDNMQLVSWSKYIYEKIVRVGLLHDLDYTDDGLFLGKFTNEDLPKILNFGIHTYRPHLKGKWLEDKSRRLAHKIFPVYKKCNIDRLYCAQFYSKLLPSLKKRIFKARKSNLPNQDNNKQIMNIFEE